MNQLRIINIYPETISDGFGIRYSIYLAGCNHGCKGCHNPKSWNPNEGSPLTSEFLEKIVDDINKNPMLDGITLSGGDPFFEPELLLQLLIALKEQTHQNIWCYTGYTLEEIAQHEVMARCLSYIDTLIDGPYIEEKNDPSLYFRGSSNQRIINLKGMQQIGDSAYSLIRK